MAFPTPWPPRPPSGVRSIRFFVSGTSTANFADNAFLFIDGAAGSANPFTPGPPTSTSSGVTNNPLTPTGTGSQGVVSQLTSPDRPLIWSGNIRISNDSTGELQVSFDGTNVHGVSRPPRFSCTATATRRASASVALGARLPSASRRGRPCLRPRRRSFWKPSTS